MVSAQGALLLSRVARKGVGRLSLGLSDRSTPSALTWINGALDQSLTARRRRALPITLTDDSAMAAAAIWGDSSQPSAG